MKTLYESILDIEDNIQSGTQAMQQALANYEQCVIFMAWCSVAVKLFRKAAKDMNVRTITANVEQWRTFLTNWITNSGFHSYFDVDEESILDCPLTKLEVKDSLEYINALKFDSTPQMSFRSSGSSFEYFFDGDQREACHKVMDKLTKVLGKRSAMPDITKKVHEIERMYIA